MKKLKAKVAFLLGLAVLGISVITTVNTVKDYYEVVDARN